MVKRSNNHRNGHAADPSHENEQQADPRGQSDAASYEIGYGKPPKHTRFHAGASGNLSGRPRRSRNLTSLVSEELSKSVAVREGGKVRKLPKRVAFVVGFINKALQGDLRAIGILIPLLQRIEADQMARDQPDQPLSQHDQ